MTREQISDFCIISLANVLRVPKETVEADAVFNRLGLDSAMVVYLMMELEEKFGSELPPDYLYDYRTVNNLSRYLTERLVTRSAVCDSRPLGVATLRGSAPEPAFYS